MRILFYTYDIMKIGGIETSFHDMAVYLKSLGYDVGVRYTVCDPMRLKYFQDSKIDIKKEEKEVCDILFIGSVWRQPNMIVSKTVIQQVHADYSDDFWKGAEAGVKMIKDAEKGCDLFCPISESSSKFVKSIVNKPVITLNNVAPSKTKLEQKKHDGMIFSAFTRMTTEKGLKNYQEFRNKIEELGIKAEFRVYTNNDKSPDGWNRHDPVPDIRKELSDVDFVVSLADTEGFGYTIAEANSCGVPCIIKRAHSTSEFFSDDNLILDNCSNFTKKDLRRTIKNYSLDKQTNKNIAAAMKQIEKLHKPRVIMRVMKRFYDLNLKVYHNPGDYISVDRNRADELLANEYSIVREL